MYTRAARLLLVLSLVAGLAAASVSVGSAGPLGGPDCVHFPWVPNGVEIEDPVTGETSGPYYGNLTIQNLEDEAIRFYVMPYGACDTVNPGQYHLIPLGARESVTYPIGTFLYIPGGTGGGISVVGRMEDDNQKPARIHGVMRQVSPEPTAIEGETSDEQVTVSGYTALSEHGIAGEVYLPIAQTNSNWNTIIRATNFDTQDTANIHVTLHEAAGGGTLGPYFELTGPGETASFDLRDLGVPDDWIGTVVVTGGLPIAAVAERIKIETNMLMMNTSRSWDQVGKTTFAALIFRDWNDWNTGVSVANLANVPNDITITFYDMDGNVVHNDGLTIPANGMDFVYMPAGGGEPFVGAAIVEGTEAFHGTVDEVKYFGDDPDTGHAMSYSLDYRGTRDGSALSFPLTWKGDPVDGSGDTSGIQVFNPTAATVEVQIIFYEMDGTPALPAPVAFSLDSHESYTAYTLGIEELSPGFTGHAVVKNLKVGNPGDPYIVAVSNLVNYEVQYDGSTSYNGQVFAPDDPCGGPC